MSLLRGEKNRDYFSKVTNEFKKFSSYIRGFSSSGRREKDKLDKDELSPGPPKRKIWGFSGLQKSESLSPRSKLAEGKSLFMDKKTSASFQIPADKLKPITTTNSQKSSPREGHKLSFRIQTKEKRADSTSHLEEETSRKLVPIQQQQQQQQQQQTQQQQPLSYAEIFLSRYAKLQNVSMFTNPEPVHCSVRSHTYIKGFAVCTNQGLVRNYNEDRVSITLGAIKPANKQNVEQWPPVNIFGVMDGHGGAKCAEFLRDHLHLYILKNRHFPKNPEEALKEACEEADRDFLKNALKEADGGEKKHERSGSCAVVLVTVDDQLYFCNVGDSRAVISKNYGGETIAVTKDHKPCDKEEQARIEEAGGSVYQNQAAAASKKKLDADSPFNIPVPFRISPGRLSVSRAFGDIEAKLPKFGGNPDVLICRPDVTKLAITGDCDFIVLGCDGIYDIMTNEEVTETVWNSLNSRKAANIHELLKLAVQDLIKEAMLKKSLDNVTALIISLNSLDYKFKTVEPTSGKLTKSKKVETTAPKWDYYNQEDVKKAPSVQLRRPSKKISIKTDNLSEAKPMLGNEQGHQSARVKTNINHYGFDLKLNSAKLSDKGKDPTRRSSGSLPKIAVSKTPR